MSDGYPADWETRRTDVYQRDDYACQNCGALGGPRGNAELHAHHIVPKSKGGTHKRSNLKTMCSECHKAIHGDAMAPDPEELLPANRDSIHVTTVQDLVSHVGDTVDLYRELRSHPILEGSNLSIDGDIDHEMLATISKKRLILTDYTELSFETEARQEAVEELRQTTAQQLYLMTDVLACLSEFYDVAQETECPSCGSEQAAKSDYCGDCGTALPTLWECPDCNRSVNTWQNEFCTHCGGELDSVPAEQAQALDETLEEIETAVEQADAKSQEISAAFDQFQTHF